MHRVKIVVFNKKNFISVKFVQMPKEEKLGNHLI